MWWGGGGGGGGGRPVFAGRRGLLPKVVPRLIHKALEDQKSHGVVICCHTSPYLIASILAACAVRSFGAWSRVSTGQSILKTVPPTVCARIRIIRIIPLMRSKTIISSLSSTL